ncbi:MAG TPA: ribonuclease R [Pirellulales bacterium]|jgi:ribonuclease R|nr:ribonuclease R [Pirellulales bacterium]
MSKADWESAVMALVRKSGYRPVKPRVLAKQLGVAADDLQTFKRLLKKLVKRGALVYGANHLIGLPGAAKSEYITGVFRRMAAGFGFVRPQGTSPAAGRDHDLFIAPEHAGDASSGDTVLVRPVQGKGRPGGTRGQIVEVLERETNRFVGTYFEAAGNALVRVDGTLFTDPIYVGDPGAKNARPDDKVVFEMVRFPTHAHGGEGVIVEILGARGQPGVDTLSIIREFNLPEAFAEDTIEAARLEAERFDESLVGRHDLTATTVITIDPVDARDFDDAISLERLENGHWRLGVHIADVAHFIKPGGPLDREAKERGTSVYLPDRVLPMLPEVISNGLASLQPDRVRYAKTAFLEFTADGIRVATDLHNSAIKSCRRFAYEEVDDYLARPRDWQSKLTPDVHGLLGRMHELAMILRGRRMRRGSLELSMQEVKVDLDRDGRVVGAHRVENTESHQIIEEFMLAANEAVAEALHAAEIPFLRRVHQAPNPIKIKSLNEFVAELGFQTASLESRFELQRLLAEVAGRPEQHAVNYAVLRSLQRAVYSPEEEGHYALASDCYCHFTSPIRRYPDLTIHRLVDGLVTHRKSRRDFTELVVLGEHCSDRERRAEAAERELTKIKLLTFFESRIGDEMDAVITGVEDFGLFAQGIEIPGEGLIRTSSLADDYYAYDKSTHSLVGRREGNRFRLGDRVRVCVARVDLDRRELDFRLVQVTASGERRAHPAGNGRDKKSRGKADHKGHSSAAKNKPPRGRKKHRD